MHTRTVPRRGSSSLFIGGLILVLASSISVRSAGLGTWSMWEDEAGSLTRAYEDPTRGFQGYFPIFFVALRSYSEWTGLSVGWLRLFPAACGVLGIAALMVSFRRQADSKTLILAGLLLSVNLGHVFFSQSVRYYTLLMVFETLALSWFFEAFETCDARKFLLSVGAWVFGLLTHFSALLLLPVFASYIIFTLWFQRDRAIWSVCCLSTITAIGGFFTWRMLRLQSEMLGDWAISSQRDPIHLSVTIIAYIGVPLLLLGLLSPWLARGLSVRFRVYLLGAAFIPLLELITLASMNFVNVTWYYAFASLAAIAILSGSAIRSTWDSCYRRSAITATVLTFGYYAAFLALYYSGSYGDRPRWAEAADYVRTEFGVRPDNPDAPPAFSNVPGPVTFHLGEHPSKCETDRIVGMLPLKLDDCQSNSVFIVELRSLPPESLEWFNIHCEQVAVFEARTGPADRTVGVYRTRETSRK